MGHSKREGKYDKSAIADLCPSACLNDVTSHKEKQIKRKKHKQSHDQLTESEYVWQKASLGE